MIIVRTILNSLPEKQKEVMQTLVSMAEPPANRNGLLSYGIYCDIDDSNVFNLISEWKSRAYLNLHLRSATFSVLLGIKGLLSKPIEFHIIKVASVEGFAAVEAARSEHG